MIFEQPHQVIAPPSLPDSFAFKTSALSKVDHANLADDELGMQMLSLFGREDLIAAAHTDFRPVECPPASASEDVFRQIERGAKSSSIVIVSESHSRTDHRWLTTELLKRLRQLGYDTLALETLYNPKNSMRASFRTFLSANEDGFLKDTDGWYVSEAAFGRMGRSAAGLGYRLVAYEAFSSDSEHKFSRADQIAVREERQAENLAAYMRENPGAKLIVHVGYSHAREAAGTDGSVWMGARLKAKTGIDPFTISQTICSGGASKIRIAQLPDTQLPGSFDLIVDHPSPKFVNGRPAWRVAAGDQPVAIPAELLPTKGWRVIEARPVGEPLAAVPMDRVAVRPRERVALMLPPGRYTLSAYDLGDANNAE